MSRILYHGDCLEIMPTLAPQSIDMILCDLPYGTTACKWDSVIPFEPLWREYKRLIKPRGAIVLTASQPFTSALVMSNAAAFSHAWVWDKKIPSGMSYARFQPMRQHEDILVFSYGSPVYYPQKTQRGKPIKSGGNKYSESAPIQGRKDGGEAVRKTYTEKNPTTILSFDKMRRGSVHPTQKPVALFEYLIKTYTQPGVVVLDNCAGSGTTGVACDNTGRRYVLIEKDRKYCEVIEKRLGIKTFLLNIPKETPTL